MINLTELSLLLAATALFGMLLLGLQLYRIKHRHAQWSQSNEQHLSELKHSLTRSAARAEHLAKLVGGLREQVTIQNERVEQIEQQDPRKLPISQAARLASLGTSQQDLARACGLSRSEAALLAKLYPGQKPIKRQGFAMTAKSSALAAY